MLISDPVTATVGMRNSDIGNICGVNVTVRFLIRYKHLTLTDSALSKAPVFRADHRLNIHLSGKRRATPQTHNKQVLQFPWDSPAFLLRFRFGENYRPIGDYSFSATCTS